tara:strand:- start:174 stop:473 length:300 start_codon:yes stop_codon:yes gene_type:complete
MAPNYDELPTVTFAIFKNKYAKSERHPSEVGEIEMTREFLKEMTKTAKATGVIPKIGVAMWEMVSKKGLEYKNFKLEIKQSSIPNVVEEVVEEDDGLPF